jgi:DNA replication and repair protein RecF
VWLSEIEVDRLRNLVAVRLELPAGLTLIAGRNGQGKTSLMEAIYLLGTGRSFRTRSKNELVAWNGGPLRVAGRVHNRLGRSRLEVTVQDGERRLVADGGEQELDRFIGRLAVVDLTAERMNVIRGGPEERRRFLDRGVVGLRPSHLRSLGEYRRVLQQRNALLRGAGGEPGTARSAQLDAWDRRLVETGAELHLRRSEYAVALDGELDRPSDVLFGGDSRPRLVYRPSPPSQQGVDKKAFMEDFLSRLGRTREGDLLHGHTGLGPHRDELLVELEGVDLRRYGSAGQVRAAMVALKLGKLALLQREIGEAPLFLMDDFDSHLDELRAAALAGFLQQGGFQTLVATSKEGLADRFGVAFEKILVENGRARVG